MSGVDQEQLKQLFAEFPHDDISWRSQSLNQAGDSALALAYIDARNVMDRLDQICGAHNWQDRYEFHGPRTICYLSIRIGEEWITKADGAGDSDVEAEKGAISDALKRAAVKWGIGRYLYDLGSPWVPCESSDRGGKRYWKRWTKSPWDCLKTPPAIQAAPASKTDRREPYKALQSKIVAHTDADKLSEWWRSDATKQARLALPEDWRKTLAVELADHGKKLRAASQPKELEETFA
jgi:hypothetical protein